MSDRPDDTPTSAEPKPAPPPARSTIVQDYGSIGSGSLDVDDRDLGIELASGIVMESRDPAKAGHSTIILGGQPQGRARMATLPRDFGKYELVDEIGRGGMGVVYKARDRELDRVVAIKMILASHLASPDQVERFYAEARAAARITSPQVVGIHDVGQIHGQHYFSMDYVSGPSLAQLLHEGPLDPQESARYVFAVARAVAHLHSQGILHRDLKPSNVLLDEGGRPRVTDFGLAKILQTEGRMTRTGAIVGTPGYMAPEQAAGKAGEVGPLSDVYSLGAILYELLTGRPPFSGETPLDTLVQVLEGEPPRPSRLRPGLPRALELICLKCLERSPEDRYPSAKALADDLDHFLRGEQIEARKQGVWQHLRRWARREPALVSRLGTMGICGAIIQANHYLIQNTEPPSQRWSIAAVVTWAVASLLFQAILSRERWANLARYLWAAADVILYTLLVQINDGLSTSLVAGYFLLVAASGLWFREHLVWVTTAMSVAGYGVLVLIEDLLKSTQVESPYRHVVFVAALAVSGLITSYQVKRVRALSQYYETRPLP
jgi:serine/threonine-protein kinase